MIGYANSRQSPIDAGIVFGSFFFGERVVRVIAQRVVWVNFFFGLII